MELVARGQVDETATPSRLKLVDHDDHVIIDDPVGSRLSGAADVVLFDVLEKCASAFRPFTVRAVGHRIVHGGERYIEPTVLSDQVLEDLESLDSLAPLHQPQNIAAVRKARTWLPEALHVGVFDTAFHRSLSTTARRFGLPRQLEAAGLRRYGFHGLSYAWLVRRMSAIDPKLAAGRLIYAHLGSGASLCAVSSGQSVDTTMGLTALDGLVMSTRCGALDPGVILHLISASGMSCADITDLLYRRSGLLGVSGESGDLRILMSSRTQHAAEAVDLFVFRIIREIGALTATLGGLDGLVFSGGVGEHIPEIRRRICSGLSWMGFGEVSDDPGADGRISTALTKPAVYVIPADEERIMAAEVRHLI